MNLLPLIPFVLLALAILLAVASSNRESRRKKKAINALSPGWYEEQCAATCPWVEGRNFVLVEGIRCGWVKHHCVRDTYAFMYHINVQRFSEDNIRCDEVSAQLAQARYDRITGNKQCRKSV